MALGVNLAAARGRWCVGGTIGAATGTGSYAPWRTRGLAGETGGDGARPGLGGEGSRCSSTVAVPEKTGNREPNPKPRAWVAFASNPRFPRR